MGSQWRKVDFVYPEFTGRPPGEPTPHGKVKYGGRPFGFLFYCHHRVWFLDRVNGNPPLNHRTTGLQPIEGRPSTVWENTPLLLGSTSPPTKNPTLFGCLFFGRTPPFLVGSTPPPPTPPTTPPLKWTNGPVRPHHCAYVGFTPPPPPVWLILPPSPPAPLPAPAVGLPDHSTKTGRPCASTRPIPGAAGDLPRAALGACAAS